MRTLKIATRGSKLALTQAEQTKASLAALGVASEIMVVKTKGDLDRSSSLVAIGGDGLFVRSIEKVLLNHEADIAVHCTKDLPYRLADGLMIGAVPKAASPADILIMRRDFISDATTDAVPASTSDTSATDHTALAHTEGQPLDLTVLRDRTFVIGTGSPRRVAECRKLFPKASFKDIRGNVPTRLQKLDDGEYDAILLGKAGIERLGMDLSAYVTHVFSVDEMIPACGQGVLAIECRTDDTEVRAILEQLTDADSRTRFDIERALFTSMKADCSVATGVHVQPCTDTAADQQYEIHAMYETKKVTQTCTLANYPAVCAEIRAELLAGEVTIVGAGSHRDLLTLKGLDAIQTADAILYDDLIDKAILDYARPGCAFIYVGKRSGKHSMTQDQINAEIIKAAHHYRKVVRLKGGDSFVFGRGGEEVLALNEAHVPFEMVPGVSSCISAPEKLGIPVTHRMTARSFSVITGHTADGTGENYEALAKLDGTLVFLMGLSATPKIAEGLMANGKSPQTPAAILSRVYSRDEVRIDGTLATIGELSKTAKTPAIIVVGDVAALHMESTISRPLAKKSVMLTGTPTFVSKLEQTLKPLGADLIKNSCLRIQPIADSVPTDYSDVDWLVFTSSNGVRIFFDQLKDKQTDLRTLAHLNYAVIGSGTAELLEAHGIYPDFIPSTFTGKVLGEELGARLQDGEKVLILRAAIGNDELTEALTDAGVDWTNCAVYDTLYGSAGSDTTDSAPLTANETAAKTVVDCDYVVFASASGVRAFFAQHTLADTTTAVCIGPYSEKELMHYRTVNFITADTHTAEGIAQLLLTHVRSNPSK